MQLPRSTARLMAASALASGALAATLLTLASPAFAETATAAPDADTKVDQIVVTGALRTQRLQEAPMAVTAVAPEEFTNAGYKSPLDLQFLSPSVQVSIQGADAIYIRGSGTNNTNPSGEQSVGLVIDGVLIGFTDDIGGDISDLDHTEVYRGPQGTQFAMNTSAGAVAILTKKPQIGVNATIAHFSYGTHDDTADYVTQNVPISDQLAGRFTASFQHRDGVFDNTSLGLKSGGRQQSAVRGKLLYMPNDKFKATIEVDARRTDEFPNFPQAFGACGPGITEPFPTIFGGNVLPPCNGALIGAIGSGGTGLNVNPNNSTSVEDQKAYRHTKTGGLSATLDYQLGDYTLTSITAYRLMNRIIHGPIGTGYYSAFYLDDSYQGNQTSEELRLSSPATSKLTYVAGLFYYDRNTVEKGLFAGSNYGMAQAFFPNTIYGQSVRISFDGGQDRTHNDNKSYAAYTDGSYHFTDKLQVNAGIRITRDDILAQIVTNPVAGVFPAFGATKKPGSLELKSTGYTWRLGPQYFITPDIQVYGTWAHGYKGPLIDASVAVLNPVLAEENNMLEAGLKSSWFDHRLTANVTLFHEKYKNYQITVLNQSVTPNVFQLGNAGGMLSQGVEVELNGRVSPDWRLSAGLSYNDNHYTDFKTSCWNALEPIKEPTSGKYACITANGQSSVQAAGSPLINSSKYTYRLSANYNHSFADVLFDASATYLWRSKFLSAPIDPNLVVPGYGIMNVDAGISSPDGKYRLGLFARNLFNKFFEAGRQASNGGYTNVLNTEAVRTVGVSLDMKYQ